MGNWGYNPTYRVTLSRSFFPSSYSFIRVIYVIYKGQQNTVSNVRVVDSSPNLAARVNGGFLKHHSQSLSNDILSHVYEYSIN